MQTINHPRISNRFLAQCDIFEKSLQPGADRNDQGLHQFMIWESSGVYPDKPEAYFTRLLDGKKWWEWQLNEMAASYFSGDWSGWNQLKYSDGWSDTQLAQLARRLGRDPSTIEYGLDPGICSIPEMKPLVIQCDPPKWLVDKAQKWSERCAKVRK